MATQAYVTWDRLGRPYKVARPIAYMVAYAKAHGVPWLGTLGSDDARHLQAPWPEDHCPFSFTGWPLALPLATPVDGERYWVCACDLGNEQGLGAAILRDARAGHLPWLKYMNVAGRNYAYADGFRNGAPNADEHIHLSCFSDDLLTDITGYDPLGVEDMALSDDPDFQALKQRVYHTHVLDSDKIPLGLKDSAGKERVETNVPKAQRVALEKRVTALSADIAELKSRPAAPAAVVDPVALDAAVQRALAGIEDRVAARLVDALRAHPLAPTP